jgi:hypothetical protein
VAVVEQVDRLRAAWLNRLNHLIRAVELWATDLGWSTRQIEIRLSDSRLGAYAAPALLLQKEAIRLLLEPIAASAPGAEGVVDLYWMPAYDDVATLYFYGGEWHLHCPSRPGDAVAEIPEVIPEPLTLDSFRSVLDQMTQHVAEQI